MRMLVLRAVWLTLPLSAGAAASEALAQWDDALKIVGAVLVWLAWGIGAVAVLAPRPVGLTALRTIAPTFAILAVLVAVTADASDAATAAALVATVLASALVALPDIAVAAANSGAYGDERRFPLRVPPSLFVLLVPLARVACVVGLAGGPLLIADGSVGWGVLALFAGVPLAALAARSLLVLALRWLVLVPAGIVVVDPMTLADSVLVVRRHVRALRAAPGTVAVPDGAVDLRLGATLGTVVLDLDTPVPFVRTGRRRREAVSTPSSTAVLAVVTRPALLAAAAERRVSVEVVDHPREV
jgi:hypothetical protein